MRDYDKDERINGRVEKILHRLRVCKLTGFCSFCPPHDYENKTHYGKHGKNKPKYKNKRR